MADVARKALTDLEERTGTAYDDLMHVNSGGSDYKETKRNFLKGDLYYNFDNTTLITTQLENLPNGTYIGSIDSYGHQAETGVPANNSYYVYARKTGGSNMFISLVGVSQAGYEYYKIKSTQGWASDWTQKPTRAEVNTLKDSFVRDLAQIAGGATKTFTVANSTRMLLVLLGSAAVRMAVYNVFVTSQGVVTATPVLSATNITLTTGTNSITIGNTTSGGTYVYVNAIVFAGSISG